MTALPKPTKLVRAFSSQLKTLCEGNYAASILKHMRVPVCQEMIQIAFCHVHRQRIRKKLIRGSIVLQKNFLYSSILLEAMRNRLTRLEQEADHPTLVSVRLLIDEYAEVVATLTRY